ncbi:hypothetical protein TRFO_35399 [Tritrichomonas foetus]|uniref:Uncharacterized protein n=1 Tax=Tritrichomonas foetus TaxID=1144522 RepID=A0A1J4JGH0_9EUKA|nr:hypothetical protein TRFO_35399 [Tritrichomonas foetus]|eukprot:OHS98242.1 hypothetical protein TRFO_35399 [Tritrichomonas foetus]
MGTPEKKKMVDVITDLISNMDFSKFKKDAGDNKENDLGEVPENVDFSKPEGEAENAEAAPSTQ